VGNQAVQRFKSEKENFECNTVSHRMPVKIMQNWDDMSRTPGMGEYSGSRVLNVLQFGNGAGGKTNKKCIAVIKT